MKSYPTILVFVALLAADPFSAFAQERTWKDSTGSYTVRAELVDVVDGKVVLKKQNGNVISVPLSVLSAEDQEFIRDLEKPKADPITAPKIEPPANGASKPPMNDLTPAVEQPVTESSIGPSTSNETADTEPTANKPVSPPLPIVAAETRVFIRFDPTHFDFTDIPPRPTRMRKTPAVGNDIAKTDSAEPETNPSTKSAITDVDIPDEAIVSPDQPDSPAIVTPEIELTVDEINLLPNPYSQIGKTLFASDDPKEIRDAMDELAENWPISRNETILKLIRKSTTCPEKFCRLKAINLLSKHDMDDGFPYILARLNDNSFEIRWAVLDLIGQTQDPRALQPVVDRFITQDRAKISSVLLLYGSQSELALHKYLTHGRADVRMEASLLLGKLGTAESIPILETIASTDNNTIVVLQARSAIRNIKKRLGLD